MGEGGLSANQPGIQKHQAKGRPTEVLMITSWGEAQGAGMCHYHQTPWLPSSRAAHYNSPCPCKLLLVLLVIASSLLVFHQLIFSFHFPSFSIFSNDSSFYMICPKCLSFGFVISTSVMHPYFRGLFTIYYTPHSHKATFNVTLGVTFSIICQMLATWSN